MPSARGGLGNRCRRHSGSPLYVLIAVCVDAFRLGPHLTAKWSLIQTLTSYLASGMEACAAVTIACATVQAMVGAAPLYLRRAGSLADKKAIRLRMGGWLALGLEFELGADILRTAISPAWNEIGQLAAIIALRTALNFFLQKEIETAVPQTTESGSLRTQARPA